MKKNTRILIVDDQKDLRDQLAKLLRTAGKRGETVSLVKQMRDRLLGRHPAGETLSAEDDEPSYDVATAAQGQEGFEMVCQALKNQKPFAIVFLDMRMPPGWDGLETARRIREVDKNVEIVVMTAYADHDQKTISEVVGTPEKLLYIKKPFQTEEIYQMALSLTSKWTAEEYARNKGVWLERLVRSMSKIQYSASLAADDYFQAVLQSLTEYTQTTRGFLTIPGAEPDAWRILASAGVEREEALAFAIANSERLRGIITTQNLHGKYILPLKKDKFFGVAVFHDACDVTEPEWFKLLSLLLMTASHSLRNAVEREGSPLDAAKAACKTLSAALADIKANGAGGPRLADAIAACREIAVHLETLSV